MPRVVKIPKNQKDAIDSQKGTDASTGLAVRSTRFASTCNANTVWGVAQAVSSWSVGGGSIPPVFIKTKNLTQHLNQVIISGMKSTEPQTPFDLLHAIIQFNKAGFSVLFEPLPSPYGVVISQIKIIPPKGTPLGDTIQSKLPAGVPASVPYVATFNLIVPMDDVEDCFSKALRLFLFLGS